MAYARQKVYYKKGLMKLFQSSRISQANWMWLRQAITNTLEDHISKTVDPAKADYAVIVGVQIHAGVKAGLWTPESFIDYFAPGLLLVPLCCSVLILRRNKEEDAKSHSFIW